MAGAKYRKPDREDLEIRLAQVLVPIEPDAGFVRNLRAKLVIVEGERKFSVWMVLVVLATMLLVLVTWLGLILRFILGWVNVLNRIASRRKGGQEMEMIAS
jgi:hypothetical protein